jgi:hypothetical protein
MPTLLRTGGVERDLHHDAGKNSDFDGNSRAKNSNEPPFEL